MKLIEGMKETKHTLRKMEDMRKKISTYCADLDVMQPTYGSAEAQKAKVSEWLQSHHDLALKLTKLKKDILRTNLATTIAIKVGGTDVPRTITEWVIRRREIINLEVNALSALTDRDLAQRGLRTLGSREEADKLKNARVRFYYDASERDKQLEILKEERESIDKALEIANATTDLME